MNIIIIHLYSICIHRFMAEDYRNFSIRLPPETYNAIQEIVKQKNAASPHAIPQVTISSYCRDVLIESIKANE